MGSGWFGSGWFDTLGSGWQEVLSSGGSDVPVFAMRVDRPLADVPLTSYNFAATFPDRDWDPDLLALTILPQFLAVQLGGQTWDQAVIAALPGPTPITPATISTMLIDAVTERPESLGEIVQQHNNFQVTFLQLLNMSHASHPKTFLLMKLAARVGEFTMMYLKRLTAPWNLRHRPRPAQVCPTLFPPVPIPGHSSYPAGHALIAWLTVSCLEDIPTLNNIDAYRESLEAMADRIGQNRVFAGLHFPEDIDAGKLAGQIIHQFISDASCTLYQDTLADAIAEWN
jgi:membrane-associated phospholipid phosphatase